MGHVLPVASPGPLPHASGNIEISAIEMRSGVCIARSACHASRVCARPNSMRAEASMRFAPSCGPCSAHKRTNLPAGSVEAHRFPVNVGIECRSSGCEHALSRLVIRLLEKSADWTEARQIARQVLRRETALDVERTNVDIRPATLRQHPLDAARICKVELAGRVGISRRKLR